MGFRIMAIRKNVRYSQEGQDLWVIDKIQHNDKKYFVDIGAHNGVNDSNTLLLEQKGWNGLCVEPNKKIFQKLSNNRKCKCVNTCISGDGKVKEFLSLNPSGWSGIKDFLRPSALKQRILESYQIDTVTLLDLFRQHDVPKYIDYLSLDTEGSEYEILKNFPFDLYYIKLITVEHGKQETKRNKILDLLTTNHFERHNIKRNTIDDYYINTSQVK